MDDSFVLPIVLVFEQLYTSGTLINEQKRHE